MDSSEALSKIIENQELQMVDAKRVFGNSEKAL